MRLWTQRLGTLGAILLLVIGWACVAASLFWLVLATGPFFAPRLQNMQLQQVGPQWRLLLSWAQVGLQPSVQPYLSTLAVVILSIVISNRTWVIDSTTRTLGLAARTWSPVRALYPEETLAVESATIARIWRIFAQAVSSPWRSYDLHTALRTGRPRAMTLSTIRRSMFWAEGVSPGHIDFNGRRCGARAIDALGLMMAGIRPEQIPPSQRLSDANLDEIEREKIRQDIRLLGVSLIAGVGREYRRRRINKIVCFDTQANVMLAQSLAKPLGSARTAAGATAPAHPITRLRVVRDQGAGFAFHPVDVQGLRGASPIAEKDRVLIVEANLADKEVIERIVCLIRKQCVRDVEVHVACLFDGSPVTFRRSPFGVRTFYRVVRADLGITLTERCKHCGSFERAEILTPPKFDFTSNYGSC